MSINWWSIVAVGVVVVSLYGAHKVSVHNAVKLNTQEVVAQMNKEYQIKLDKAVTNAIASTKQLQADADAKKDEKYAKLESNNAKLLADVKFLQRRAKRPSPEVIAKSSESGSTCTAAQLYREDAEFLTGEAARAESVLIERDSYYERYNAAKRELDSLATEKK